MRRRRATRIRRARRKTLAMRRTLAYWRPALTAGEVNSTMNTSMRCVRMYRCLSETSASETITSRAKATQITQLTTKAACFQESLAPENSMRVDGMVNRAAASSGRPIALSQDARRAACLPLCDLGCSFKPMTFPRDLTISVERRLGWVVLIHVIDSIHD